MSDSRPRVRLRQAVLVARELEPVAAALRSALGLGEPFRDPGVGEFGLDNAVFALGDCFLEVISPARPDTAAGRYLARHGGDGGYMVIFDLERSRGRARCAPSRRACGSCGRSTCRTSRAPTCIRPTCAARSCRSTSRDRMAPGAGAGPQWTGRTGAGAPGRLAGITVAVRDPRAVAARWGAGARRRGRRRAAAEARAATEARGPLRRRGRRARRRVRRDRSRAPPSCAGSGEAIELGGVRLRAAGGSQPVGLAREGRESAARGARRSSPLPRRSPGQLKDASISSSASRARPRSPRSRSA